MLGEPIPDELEELTKNVLNRGAGGLGDLA